MYTKFFGLKKRPFALTPDPAFLYLSQGHDLAFAHLEYGILHNVGFVALTGEVGAGKTTLLKHLLSREPAGLDIAMVFNTLLDPLALLEMLAKEFGLTPVSGRKSDLVDALLEHFIQQYSRGQRCVVVIDEAQNLPDETFEELRMLSNLDTEDDNLLQIILVGQPQLRSRLSHPALAQLTQRISVHYHLASLRPDEIENYIQHRLEVAGYAGTEPLFHEEAVSCIADISRGIPRIINSVCDASLTYAFADGMPRVTAEIARKVIADNQLLFVHTKEGEGEEAAAAPLGEQAEAIALGLGGDAAMMLASLCRRLDALETRIEAFDADERDRALGILRDMLAKERERSLRYEKKLASLSRMYREVQDQLEALKKAREEAEPKRKSKSPWRMFSSENH